MSAGQEVPAVASPIEDAGAQHGEDTAVLVVTDQAGGKGQPGQCQRHGRSLRELSVAVALADGSPGVLPELARAGVTEFVVVATPPAHPAAATTWVAELAAQWGLTPGQ